MVGSSPSHLAPPLEPQQCWEGVSVSAEVAETERDRQVGEASPAAQNWAVPAEFSLAARALPPNPSPVPLVGPAPCQGSTRPRDPEHLFLSTQGGRLLETHTCDHPQSGTALEELSHSLG